MLYGKDVRAGHFSHILIFAPDLRYVDFIPALGDNWIFGAETPDIAKKRSNFPRSVLMKETGYDVDLTNRKVAIAFANKMQKMNIEAREYFLGVYDELEFWNSIKIHIVRPDIILDKLVPKMIQEKIVSSAMYRLFQNLGGSREKLLIELLNLRNRPVPLLFSCLLEFLVKMKKIDDIVGIKWGYRRDLIDVKKRISGVKRKLICYLGSRRTFADFAELVMSL
ncbi:MAG: hypothetical protein HN337_01685 [Deltaproteobacteria bacterium]|jgi:hypothetical protein|nr:hypothetical protein [Deltaproteobacteria bacterium]